MYIHIYIYIYMYTYIYISKILKTYKAIERSQKTEHFF